MPVTLKTFDNPIDAHLIKNLLDNKGVWCALHDENISSVYPLNSFALGGIKLVIHPKDTEQALDIINQSAHHQVDNKPKQLCPHCNSSRLAEYSHGSNRIMNYLHQLGNALLPGMIKLKWVCKDCNRLIK